jgi:hypothetical protein
VAVHYVCFAEIVSAEAAGDAAKAEQLRKAHQNTNTLPYCSDLACSAEIDAAEEAGDAAKAEQLRKARRAELIRKLRQLQHLCICNPQNCPTSCCLTILLHVRLHICHCRD